jgi:hypothetical protein
MATRHWIALFLSVSGLAVAVVFAVWVFSPHGTVAHVAHWLRQEDCPEEEVAARHLPIRRSTEPAAPYLTAAERRFDDQAREVKLIECGGLGGSMSYYRFATTGERIHAVATDPGFYHGVFCAKNAEVLTGGLLGHEPIEIYCRRLGFRITHSATRARRPRAQAREHSR